MEFGVLFCVFRAKMPIFDLFFVVFPFFSEKFSLLIAAPISLKKSNRANVGVIVQLRNVFCYRTVFKKEIKH